MSDGKIKLYYGSKGISNGGCYTIDISVEGGIADESSVERFCQEVGGLMHRNVETYRSLVMYLRRRDLPKCGIEMWERQIHDEGYDESVAEIQT